MGPNFKHKYPERCKNTVRNALQAWRGLRIHSSVAESWSQGPAPERKVARVGGLVWGPESV